MESAQPNSRVLHAQNKQVALVPATDSELIVNVGGIKGTLGRGWRSDRDDVAQFELLELHVHQAVVDRRKVCSHAVVEGPRLIVAGLQILSICTRLHLSKFRTFDGSLWAEFEPQPCKYRKLGPDKCN